MLGVTAAGKTALIAERTRDDGPWSGLTVLAAHDLGQPADEGLPPGSYVVHYDLLRPIRHSVDHIGNDLLDDHVLRMLLGEPRRLLASVLVAPRAELLRRLRQREWGSEAMKRSILTVLAGLDLVGHYERVLSLLDDRGVSRVILDASGGPFRECTVEEARRVLGRASD